MDREIENNVAYTLGEMFALLENIQKQALGKDLNATIKDKFFASACGTPSLVFPRLINLAQSHLKKINKEISINLENKLGYFMSKLENGFPKTLSLDDQGLFQIGYYSQKYLINKKNNDTDKGTEE